VVDQLRYTTSRQVDAFHDVLGQQGIGNILFIVRVGDGAVYTR
jgi:hypothetical protein